MNRAGDGVHVTKMFGIRVRASYAFAIAIALLALWALRANSTPQLGLRLIFGATLIASVLAHELAHARVATMLGVPVRQIVLTWFGGFAEFSSQPPRGWPETLIALAGPAANLLIAGIVLAAIQLGEASGHLTNFASQDDFLTPRSLLSILQGIFWLNVSLAAFNALPGLPLDGGHVLRAILSTRMSRGRAAWMATWSGVFVGLGSIAAAFVFSQLGLLIAGVLVVVAAWNEKKRLRYGE